MAAINFLKTYSANCAGEKRHGFFRRCTLFAGNFWLRTALLLCAVVLLPLTAESVQADTCQNVNSSGVAKVGTWDALADALNPGSSDCIPVDKIVLIDDITGNNTGSRLIVPRNRTVTLDLNGKTINRNAGTNAIENGYVIRVDGNLTISGNGTITGGNNNDSGGGVFVADGGTFTMNGGTISGNTVTSKPDEEERYFASGGGVCVAGGGTFNMQDGAISGNTVTSNLGGGGVFVDLYGTFTMEGGTISGNIAHKISADGYGGGVFVSGEGCFSMSGGSITGNTADNNGGGVFLSSPLSDPNPKQFTISGSPQINKNNAVIGNDNDNVYLNPDTIITISGALSKSSNESNIGIKMQTPGEFTSGLKAHNGSLDFFSSDEQNYDFRWNGDESEAQLTGVYTIRINGGFSIPNGKIESAPADKAAAGEIVKLTVTPDPGYMLKEKLLQVLKNSEPDMLVPVTFESETECSFTMPKEFKNLSTDHVNITAEFIEPEQYFVKVTSNNADYGSAFVRTNGGKVSEVQGISGTNVQLTEDARKGYQFIRWELDHDAGTLSGDTYTIGTANVTITAVFEKIPGYNVTVKNDGNGTASANPDHGPAGTKVNLTPVPNDGYGFKEWQVVTGGVTVTDNSFIIGKADVEIKAVFEKIPGYYVTVKIDGNGTASANPVQGPSGTKVSLTAKPEEGSHFKEWKVNSGGVTVTDNSFTIGTANVEIEAVFEKLEKHLPVRFEHVMQDGTPSIPTDIKRLTWGNLQLEISKDDKKYTSEKFSLDIIPGDRFSPISGTTPVLFYSDLDVNALSAYYAFTLTGFDPEVSADIYSSEGLPVKKYKVTVVDIVPKDDADQKVFLQIKLRWDDGSGNGGQQPEMIAVYALPEDEIGAYVLNPDGTKEYLLFHTYELCMMYLGSDELCSGPERCFHK